VAKPRHRRTPVHSMAEEPVVRYEDIAVDSVVREAESVGTALLLEVEREYGPDPDDSPEVSPGPDGVGRRLTLADLTPEVDGLSGPEQDDHVDALEELKEIAETVAKEGTRECPSCHRPLVAATRNAAGEETKSSRIRRMAAEGMSKGDIARSLGITYQFVHNVLSRPQKLTG
jgi:hypothetical protein